PVSAAVAACLAPPASPLPGSPVAAPAPVSCPPSPVPVSTVSAPPVVSRLSMIHLSLASKLIGGPGYHPPDLQADEAPAFRERRIAIAAGVVGPERHIVGPAK